MRCFYCGVEDGIECTSGIHGEEVQCQMENPQEPHYGDYCYVGHNGNTKIICQISKSVEFQIISIHDYFTLFINKYYS